MKKTNITKERKYIIIAGSFLLLVAAFYRFYPFIEIVFSSNDEIRLRQQKIQKYKELSSQRDVYENRLNHLNRGIERAESVLLNGNTAPLAAVDLQNIINDIARSNNIEIKTTRVLNTENIEGGYYSRISIEFSFESSIRQLKDFIYKIESHPKLFIVQNIKLGNSRLKGNQNIKSTISVAGFTKTEGEIKKT